MIALRPVRSFVLRQGRMSPAQVRACDELLPRYGVAVDRPLVWRQVFGRTAPVVLEIGFGMGESTAKIAYLMVRRTGAGHLERCRVWASPSSQRSIGRNRNSM